MGKWFGLVNEKTKKVLLVNRNIIRFWDVLNAISMLMRKKGTATSDEKLKYVGTTPYFGQKLS